MPGMGCVSLPSCFHTQTGFTAHQNCSSHTGQCGRQWMARFMPWLCETL